MMTDCNVGNHFANRKFINVTKNRHASKNGFTTLDPRLKKAFNSSLSAVQESPQRERDKKVFSQLFPTKMRDLSGEEERRRS